MKLQRLVTLIAVGTVVALLLTACPPGVEPQPTLLETMEGSWVATESVVFYGATLTNTLSLTVSGGDIALGVTVSDGAGERNNLTLSGTVGAAGSDVTFTYSGGTQAADNGDGTFDPATQEDLTAADLAAIMTDLGGTRTAAVSGTTLIVDEGLATELVFEKQH